MTIDTLTVETPISDALLATESDKSYTFSAKANTYYRFFTTYEQPWDEDNPYQNLNANINVFETDTGKVAQSGNGVGTYTYLPYDAELTVTVSGPYDPRPPSQGAFILNAEIVELKDVPDYAKDFDVAGDPSTSHEVFADAPLTGYFNFSNPVTGGDIDYYRFQAEAGYEYQIRLTPQDRYNYAYGARDINDANVVSTIVASWWPGLEDLIIPSSVTPETYFIRAESSWGQTPWTFTGAFGAYELVVTTGKKTFFATDDADVFVGTDIGELLESLGGADTLDAGAGDDTIKSGSGADNVSGGPGDDLIHAGAGDDEIRGEDGDDTVNGGSGDDQLHGNNGDDAIRSGGGSDTIFGGRGDDDINGGTGADKIYGGSDDDMILGGSGADQIKGQFGDDIIHGEAGADTLSGGMGNDTIYGGDGADIFVFNAAPNSNNSIGNDVVADFIGGEDKLFFNHTGIQYSTLDFDGTTLHLTTGEKILLANTFGLDQSDILTDYSLIWG